MSFKKPNIKRSPAKAIKRIEQIAKEMKGEGQVKVGLPEGSNAYPDGTSVIMVGAVHEFGSPSRNIPERSYLRSTMQNNRRAYKKVLSKLGRMIATGEMDADKALETLGLKVENDVKATLTNLKTPVLTSRDGNPLIDTGHLRQTITHKVEN